MAHQCVVPQRLTHPVYALRAKQIGRVILLWRTMSRLEMKQLREVVPYLRNVHPFPEQVGCVSDKDYALCRRVLLIRHLRRKVLVEARSKQLSGIAVVTRWRTRFATGNGVPRLIPILGAGPLD